MIRIPERSASVFAEDAALAVGETAGPGAPGDAGAARRGGRRRAPHEGRSRLQGQPPVQPATHALYSSAQWRHAPGGGGLHSATHASTAHSHSWQQVLTEQQAVVTPSQTVQSPLELVEQLLLPMQEMTEPSEHSTWRLQVC